MPGTVITVEPNARDTMNYPTGERDEPNAGDDPAQAASPRRATPKFVYPGGSRPLDGYTIKRGVGHGGFGEIYYAVSDAGKEVALKLIRRNLDIELRGIRHCLNLRHPNLLNLYDIRQDSDGDTWVVMEYIAGGCLADLDHRHPNGMPLQEALDWFRGIGAGVAYLHSQGIVHRDLKPGNVFSDQGIIKVGDYGLSKFISCSQRSGQTESVGTVHYMAPEVANGRYGKEIDIYALGIVLYELLTGHVPFEGESIGEVLMKHLTATPDVSVLDQPYRHIVAKALRKDPEKRYRSVDQMLAALSEPVPASTDKGAMPAHGAGAVPRAKVVSVTATAATSAPSKDADATPQEVIVQAEAVEEEPILKAVQDGYARVMAAWDEADLPIFVKIVLLVALVFLLASSAGAILPMAVTLVIMYGVYRVVRALVIPGPPQAVVEKPRQPDAPRPVDDSPPQKARVARRYRRKLKRQNALERATATLRQKPAGQRVVELIGSMLVGALVAIAMSIVMIVAHGFFGIEPPAQSDYAQLAQYAWLVLVSVVGTWAVLIPSKFWEGTKGEAILRRFVMLAMGFLVGGVAYLAASMLFVHLPFNGHWGFDLTDGFRNPAGRLMATAHLACFGSLFLVLRWWNQANPLRYARLSLLSLLATTLMAAFIAGIWNYPLSWLMMAAGAISVSVQLASPWMTPAQRVPAARRG